jgi:hypothetical protein
MRPLESTNTQKIRKLFRFNFDGIAGAEGMGKARGPRRVQRQPGVLPFGLQSLATFTGGAVTRADLLPARPLR